MRERVAIAARIKAPRGSPSGTARISPTEAVSDARAEAAAESGVATVSMAPTEPVGEARAGVRAENGVGSTKAAGEAGAGAGAEAIAGVDDVPSIHFQDSSGSYTTSGLRDEIAKAKLGHNLKQHQVGKDESWAQPQGANISIVLGSERA